MRVKPDLQYLEKLTEILRVLDLAIASEGKIVVLFADEFTFYSQPALADDYSPRGKKIQPNGQLSHQFNTKGRVGGTVNAHSGQVHYVQESKCGIKQFLKLYEALKVAYPKAEVIFLVEDNTNG